jgi:chorismate lyase
MSSARQQSESIEWLPAERLGQFNVEGQVRLWLIGTGLLTLRMRDACGERFALRLVDQWTALLSPACRSALRATDNAGLFREVEMCSGEDVWAFEHTVMPDSTLCAHPWLAELGDCALGETLRDLSGLERGPFEFAWLPAHEAEVERALRTAAVKPAGLWARRSRMALHGAPMLMLELFMPAVGRA